jgi:hypothetical protein
LALFGRNYLVQFTVTTKGEFTAANLLNFDLTTFIEQVWASFVAVDLTMNHLHHWRAETAFGASTSP